ncbi:serine protease inhibitor 42Dd [Zeugodacus cucurbitae]|uniref:serine protease inhibitor 42Dd n=1 Tax=Zeugodacus cucurbitae TaxID=28588 RepID=UPI0023D95118|nr:serine protease inhibitor 42Dd [Zeugodacus cucurbitae]XP_028897698.2 serine protease inhibitor 42Dd [Zeugodacus cucurbitae]
MFAIRQLLLLIATAMAAAVTCDCSQTLTSQLLQTVVSAQPNDNVIVSPISIETCLALAYLGAEGQTAAELATSLQLPQAGDKRAVAQKFGRLFEKTKSATGTATFRLANRIYIDERFQVSPQYNAYAVDQMHANAESVRFADAAATAANINSWVEAETDNKIRDLIPANGLDANTALVLVNALYFKAKWVNQFHNHTTTRRHFHESAARKVEVDMMKQTDDFLYGDFPELDATAVELAYLDTDVSMLVLLPKSVDGLADLEAKLKSVDLTKLSTAMRTEEVILHLPKFKFEFELELKPVLEQFGITSMFSDEADFSSLLAAQEKVAVSQAQHKAFIEVNESGTEAAAATYLKIVPLSASFQQQTYQFVADHPFVFAIKDNENVYFVGHVTHF